MPFEYAVEYLLIVNVVPFIQHAHCFPPNIVRGEVAQ